MTGPPQIQSKREGETGEKKKGFELPDGRCYTRTDEMPQAQLTHGDHGELKVKDGAKAKLTLRFHKGCTQLMGDSYARVLNTIARYMGAGGMETYYLAGAHIHGYASSEGNPEFNDRLSSLRAGYVRDILVSNGLPSELIKTTDYHGAVEGPLPAMRKVEIDLILKKKPPKKKEEEEKDGCEGFRKYLYPWCWEFPDVDWPDIEWPNFKFWEWDWDAIWERIDRIWKFLVRLWDCHCTIAYALDLFNSKFAKAMPQLATYIETADCACNTISTLVALGSITDKGMHGAMDFVTLLVTTTADCFSLASGQIKDILAAIFFPTVPFPNGVPLPLDVIEKWFPDTSWVPKVRDFLDNKFDSDQAIDTTTMVAQEWITKSFSTACRSCLGIEEEKKTLGLPVDISVCEALFSFLVVTGTIDNLDDKILSTVKKKLGK